MHLWLSATGQVLSVGPTLAKLIPDLSDGLTDRLVSGRAGQGPCPLQAIRTAVEHRRRLFLRVVQSRDLDDPQAVRLHLKNIAQAIGLNDLVG